MSRPPEPPGLKAACIFNAIFGSMYALIGGLQLMTDNWVGGLILLFGLAMVVGSFGLLAGRRWALKYALAGLYVFAAQNVIATVVLFAVGWGSTVGLFIAGAYAMGTALQLLTLSVLRSTAAEAYLWAVTESELDQGAMVQPTLEAAHDEVELEPAVEIEVEAAVEVQEEARS